MHAMHKGQKYGAFKTKSEGFRWIGEKCRFCDKIMNTVTHKMRFPSIGIDIDPKKRRWKIALNRYLPKWQMEARNMLLHKARCKD